MTREEFIKVLEEKGYSYEIEGDKLIVTQNGNIWLSLREIPSGVEFNNNAEVYLGSLETIPPSVKFSNRKLVWLTSIKSISPGVEFMNGTIINLESITGGYFHNWEGNIKGIDFKRLLNGMIKRGVFI